MVKYMKAILHPLKLYSVAVWVFFPDTNRHLPQFLFKHDLECKVTWLSTVRPNYRQVVFSITLNFSLVFTQDGLPELGFSFKEIFLVALFEKNPKLIIFHSILHPDSIEGC